VPWISVEQMRAVDRLMIEEIGITLEQMMENAGGALASVARTLLGSVRDRRIVVLAGSGGNGGGGLVAARHLNGAGADVQIRLSTSADELAPTTRRQLAIAEATGLNPRVGVAADEAEPDLVLDAVLGYSQTGAPRRGAEQLICWTRGRRIVSLDTPSGLELATGRLHEPHVSAEATLTLALPKQGLRSPQAHRAVGRTLLADISVPPAVYRRLGIDYRSPFALGAVVELGD
jgi:NAD(P)H-hydrate epimerase